MIQQTATVLYNEKAGPQCYRLGLQCPQLGYDKALPGQFVMVRSNPTLTPLLRRPFSISGLVDSDSRIDGIELLFRVLGKGTTSLSHLAPGQRLDVIGPLGRGFRIKSNTRKVFLAAGGIGVAPIRFLARHLVDKGIAPENIHLFLGGQSEKELLCREDFASLGIGITTTTDDGSAGMQCLLTDPLEEAIIRQSPDMVYACGPHGMLQCVEGIVKRHEVACQISMETVMACGMGACLGCAVADPEDQSKFRHVCIEGPVFEIGQVDLDAHP